MSKETVWLWPVGTLICFCRAAQSNFTSPPTPPPPCYSLCIHILFFFFYLFVPALPCFMTEFKLGHHVSHCIEERIGQRWPGLHQCHYCRWCTNGVWGEIYSVSGWGSVSKWSFSQVQYIRKRILHFLLSKCTSWWWKINNFFFFPLTGSTNLVCIIQLNDPMQKFSSSVAKNAANPFWKEEFVLWVTYLQRTFHSKTSFFTGTMWAFEGRTTFWNMSCQVASEKSGAGRDLRISNYPLRRYEIK